MSSARTRSQKTLYVCQIEDRWDWTKRANSTCQRDNHRKYSHEQLKEWMISLLSSVLTVRNDDWIKASSNSGARWMCHCTNTRKAMKDNFSAKNQQYKLLQVKSTESMCHPSHELFSHQLFTNWKIAKPRFGVIIMVLSTCQNIHTAGLPVS